MEHNKLFKVERYLILFRIEKDFKVPNIEADSKPRFQNRRENIKETLLKKLATDKANQRGWR